MFNHQLGTTLVAFQFCLVFEFEKNLWFHYFFKKKRFDGTLSVVPKVISSILKISSFGFFSRYFEPSLICKRVQFHLYYVDSIRQNNCATILSTSFTRFST
jgi:hypothetical protein